MVKIGDKILQSSIQESSAIFFFVSWQSETGSIGKLFVRYHYYIKVFKKNINLQVIPKDTQEFRDLLKGWLVDYNYLFI